MATISTTPAGKAKARKKIAVAIGLGITGTISILSAGNAYFNSRYMAPVARRHLEAIVSVPMSQGGIESYARAVSIFKDGAWTQYLSEEQKEQLASKATKVEAILSAKQAAQKAAMEQERAKQAAQKQAEEERRNPDFEASLTNYFVDSAPDTFKDRIAKARNGVLTVGDVRCSLNGEKECSVETRNSRPISAKWWDASDGFVLSTARFGKQVNRGSYDPEKAANPYVALHQQRLQRMIQDFHKEQENARKNCKGLKGDSWTQCAGVQSAY